MAQSTRNYSYRMLMEMPQATLTTSDGMRSRSTGNSAVEELLGQQRTTMTESGSDNHLGLQKEIRYSYQV